MYTVCYLQNQNTICDGLPSVTQQWLTCHVCEAKQLHTESENIGNGELFSKFECEDQR